MPTIDDLQKKYEDFFKFTLKDGILEVKMHCKGGPVQWSYQYHHALSELWTDIGHTKYVECLILTSTPPYWINEHDGGSFAEVEQSPDNDQRFNVQIYDTLKVVIALLSVAAVASWFCWVPVIGGIACLVAAALTVASILAVLIGLSIAKDDAAKPSDVNPLLGSELHWGCKGDQSDAIAA